MNGKKRNTKQTKNNETNEKYKYFGLFRYISFVSCFSSFHSSLLSFSLERLQERNEIVFASGAQRIKEGP
jgi:hypothetical protein